MTKSIPLTKGLSALVDDEDFERINKNKWHASGTHRHEYAARRSKDYEEKARAIVYMHREILGLAFLCDSENHIDHINGDRLDNRKLNLRVVTRSENLQNSKTAREQKGVGYDSTHNRYKAYVNLHGRFGTKRINVGTYRTKEEAIQAREAFIIRNQLA